MSKRFITGKFSFIGAVIYATQVRTFFANCWRKRSGGGWWKQLQFSPLSLMEEVNQYALSRRCGWKPISRQLEMVRFVT